MAYDYGRYFGEIALTHDLTTSPEERSWRLTPPGREPEPHRIVLYLGCNVLRTSHMIQTITAIFDRLGLDYVAVGGRHLTAVASSTTSRATRRRRAA